LFLPAVPVPVSMPVALPKGEAALEEVAELGEGGWDEQEGEEEEGYPERVGRWAGHVDQC
jgi:hypothetical protein